MGNQASEYQAVSKLIEKLSEKTLSNATDARANLEELGAPLGLSTNQVQRLFSNWVGVSPKRFEQFLTVKSLQSRLHASSSLLDLGLDTGLSSVSRVHAHFIHFYAMTPQEYRNEGENLTIRHGYYPSPFGLAHIASTEKGICWLAFVNPSEEAHSTAELISNWPRARFVQDQTMHQDTVAALFSLQQSAPLYLHIKGTNFQLKVWEALLNIPLGQLASYQDIAKTLKQPGAARAVGSAISKNPIGWLIPCHRVIRATGHIGGYRWGSNRKTTLLGWEAAQAS